MKDFQFDGNSKISHFVESVFHPEWDHLREARLASEKMGLPPIQVGAMDGRHLEVFTRMLQAKKTVEIGTLGGYSALFLARGMAPGGKLITIEADPKHALVAQANFQKSEFHHSIELKVGKALDILPQIENQGPFDLVFIDADKVNYPNYCRWAEKNLRIGGVILGDNTFAFGMLADDSYHSKDDELTVMAIREFNERIARSGKFLGTIIPTGQGLTLGVKIS